ncbi:ATP-NAD kinase-like domain-containing protein [Phyllosticta citriasiana]|uniref:ATP-NAD kinase-like domain-containing protein n=1 Tax=Phyllosticta citriasiana TaxID=595635 RepID=A0ABR1KL67_9PEZI
MTLVFEKQAMGGSQSHSPSLEHRPSKFNGEIADFKYTRNGDKTALHCQLNDSKRSLEIYGDCVVGCVKLDDASGHKLLYVEHANESSEAKTDQIVPLLRSAVTENLPDAFVSEYTIQPVSLVQHGKRSKEGGIGRIHIIISVLSGMGLAEDFYKSSLKPLLDSLELREDQHFDVHRTTSAKTISELTNDIFLPRANQGVSQRIILLSGDGGIVDIINGLRVNQRTESFVAPSVSLIPMGTGNALAHSSGIAGDKTLGLAALARGTPSKLPLFRVLFSPGAKLLVDEGNSEEKLPDKNGGGTPVMYGAVVCSWAMHASLVADSDTTEFRQFGVERFQMAAKEALFPADGSEAHRYKAEVKFMRADGSWQHIDRHEHAYVLGTMVSNLEKNFNISPASQPLDGNLRLVHFGPIASDRIMQIMGLAYQGGKHVQETEVGYEDVEGFRIDLDGAEEDERWRRFCVDGKIVRVEREGWAEVRKVKEHVVDLHRHGS